MKYFWVKGEDKWVPASLFTKPPRVFPSIIRDDMGATIHPATGQTFDSKSAFRSATKAAGYVEMGTDAPTTPRAYVPDQTIEADVAAAYQAVRDGYTPPPLDTVNSGDFTDIPVRNF